MHATSTTEDTMVTNGHLQYKAPTELVLCADYFTEPSGIPYWCLCTSLTAPYYLGANV